MSPIHHTRTMPASRTVLLRWVFAFLTLVMLPLIALGEWPENGVFVGEMEGNYPSNIVCATDGNGGLFVAWKETTSGEVLVRHRP